MTSPDDKQLSYPSITEIDGEQYVTTTDMDKYIDQIRRDAVEEYIRKDILCIETKKKAKKELLDDFEKEFSLNREDRDENGAYYTIFETIDYDKWKATQLSQAQPSSLSKDSEQTLGEKKL